MEAITKNDIRLNNYLYNNRFRELEPSGCDSAIIHSAIDFLDKVEKMIAFIMIY